MGAAALRGGCGASSQADGRDVMQMENFMELLEPPLLPLDLTLLEEVRTL